MKTERIIKKTYNKLSKFSPLQKTQLRGTPMSGRPLARRYACSLSSRFALFAVIIFFLNGCSTMCFVKKERGVKDIPLVTSLGDSNRYKDNRYTIYDDRLGLQKLLATGCKQISQYNRGFLSVSPTLARVHETFTNGSQHCLERKARNDAVKNKGNLVNVEMAKYYGSINTTSFQCDEETIKALMHNKKRNEMDGSVEPPIR